MPPGREPRLLLFPYRLKVGVQSPQLVAGLLQRMLYSFPYLQKRRHDPDRGNPKRAVENGNARPDSRRGEKMIKHDQERKDPCCDKGGPASRDPQREQHNGHVEQPGHLAERRRDVPDEDRASQQDDQDKNGMRGLLPGVHNELAKRRWCYSSSVEMSPRLW